MKIDLLFFTDESYNGLLTYIIILLEELRKQRYVEIDYILRHPSMQLIGLTVVVYAIWYVVYRKNSNRFDEYLELQAEKNVQ